jgi:hypothetical protein
VDQYEEGDGVQGSASEKYANNRQSRKQAEEDARLLQNRIMLLRLEEKKAWKKIEETKKKAKDIMGLKQRNQENQRLKEERNRERMQQERMLQERNLNMRA